MGFFFFFLYPVKSAWHLLSKTGPASQATAFCQSLTAVCCVGHGVGVTLMVLIHYPFIEYQLYAREYVRITAKELIHPRPQTVKRWHLDGNALFP